MWRCMRKLLHVGMFGVSARLTVESERESQAQHKSLWSLERPHMRLMRPRTAFSYFFSFAFGWVGLGWVWGPCWHVSEMKLNHIIS